MRNATSAMEEAKRAGRNTFRFFTSTMDARAQARSRLASELSDALDLHEFQLAYQPVIDIASAAGWWGRRRCSAGRTAIWAASVRRSSFRWPRKSD